MRALFVCFIIFLSSGLARAEVSRIENFNVDRKKVNKIYLSYSKTGIIRFPDQIEEVRVGASEGYKYEISKTYKRELSLKVRLGVNAPSNLIVRTSNEEIYVFDLVPSRTRHQDVVYVDDSHYKTKLDRRRKVQRKKIYSHKKSKRVSLTSSKKTLIFSHKAGEEL